MQWHYDYWHVFVTWGVSMARDTCRVRGVRKYYPAIVEKRLDQLSWNVVCGLRPHHWQCCIGQTLCHVARAHVHPCSVHEITYKKSVQYRTYISQTKSSKNTDWTQMCRETIRQAYALCVDEWREVRAKLLAIQAQIHALWRLHNLNQFSTPMT